MESETASVREAILHAFFGKYSCKEGKKPSSVCVLFSFLFSSLAFFFCLRGVCVSSASCGCPNRLTKQQFFLTRSFALACVFCAFINIIFFSFFKVVSGLLFIWDPSLRVWELRIVRLRRPIWAISIQNEKEKRINTATTNFKEMKYFMYVTV
jgi:hypothetical protein